MFTKIVENNTIMEDFFGENKCSIEKNLSSSGLTHK
jgi:hypothetical protein